MIKLTLTSMCTKVLSGHLGKMSYMVHLSFILFYWNSTNLSAINFPVKFQLFLNSQKGYLYLSQ